MPVWLVTGGSGFLGRHVVEALERGLVPDVEVVTTGRMRPPRGTLRGFYQADLEDPTSIGRVIRMVRPAAVLHVAGCTPPAPPEAFYLGNALATVNLLDALREWGGPSRVVLAGSAAELGPVDVADLPVGEDHPCRPADPYGLSKWLATAAGLAVRPPLDVVVARIFNPIGPGQPPTQALGWFGARLAERPRSPMIVGDLDARRDFIDVRDVARALIALATRGRPGLVYHVGTGTSRRVGDGFDRLIELSGLNLELRVDPRLIRHEGPSDSRADIRRIVEHTGWRPQISWDQSLRDLWNEACRGSRLPLTA